MSHLTPVPDDPEQLAAWLAERAGGHDPRPLADQVMAALTASVDPLGLDPSGNRAIELPAAPDVARELTVKVSLRGAKPPIWRRLALPGDITLEALHAVLQVAMGWTDSHLHRFYPTANDRGPYFVTDYDIEEGDDGTPERDARLDQVLRDPGDRLTYDYDFGDGWSHDVRLEKVGEPAAEAVPRCLAGRMACPPEDVGGTWGYADLLAWHRAGRTPEALPGVFDDVEHALEWLPVDWDPDHLDLDEVNELLAATARSGRGLDELRFEVLQVLMRLDSPGAILTQQMLRRADHRPLSDEELTLATRHWRVLLDVVGDGVRLTSAGYLPPAQTLAVFEGLDLGDIWIGKGNREDLTPPVADLRAAAEQVGVLRKAKGHLAPTAKVRGATSAQLFDEVAGRLPLGRTDAEREAGLFALISLAGGRLDDGVYDDVALLLRSRGWQVDGRPPHRGDAIALSTPTITALLGAAVHHRTMPEWAPRAAVAALFD